jgi:hypothetical protein
MAMVRKSIYDASDDDGYAVDVERVSLMLLVCQIFFILLCEIYFDFLDSSKVAEDLCSTKESKNNLSENRNIQLLQIGLFHLYSSHKGHVKSNWVSIFKKSRKQSS